MATTYQDFTRQPSRPHQRMDHSDTDGACCRAFVQLAQTVFWY